MLRAVLALLIILPIAACSSNDPTIDDFNRVVITEVNIESWPIRMPDGDQWDSFPTADPDLYFDLVDSGGQLILTTEDDDASDVGDNEVGPQWITDIQFTNFNRTLHFEICDSDGNDCQFMDETEPFSLMTLADQGFRTFYASNSANGLATVVTIRLRWEQ